MHLSSQDSVNLTVKPVQSGEKSTRLRRWYCERSHWTYPHVQWHWTRIRNICPIWHWPILNLEYQAAWTSFSEQMCFHALCFTASSLALQDRLWLLKQCLVGYWLALSEQWELRVNRTIVASLPHLPMTSLGDFGKLRITICSSLSCPQRNKLLWIILKGTTVRMKQVGSLYLYLWRMTWLRWASWGHWQLRTLSQGLVTILGVGRWTTRIFWYGTYKTCACSWPQLAMQWSLPPSYAGGA